MPTVKAPPAEAGLTALFDIESTSKPGDDSYTGNGKKAAGAEEDEAEDSGAGEETETGAKPAEESPASRISYFA